MSSLFSVGVKRGGRSGDKIDITLTASRKLWPASQQQVEKWGEVYLKISLKCFCFFSLSLSLSEVTKKERKIDWLVKQTDSYLWDVLPEIKQVYRVLCRESRLGKSGTLLCLNVSV